ncbi:MAG TPA: DUF1016 domain-containing protein [bacterium]|nr:DUF1016 domain-containing protein [bacterium]
MDTDLKQFISEVKERIRSAQYAAMRVVNNEMISLYWDVGKMIVDKQETLGWGKSVVEQLSLELQKDFPSVKGFSTQNLWNMRQFFLYYRENENLQPLVGEVSWTKNILILQRCSDNFQKEFYLRMTAKFGWTKNVLVHQIESKAYEKYLLNQTNFDQTVPEKYKNQAILAVKDEYSFDFIASSQEHSEKELEYELMKNIRSFLLEMGADFSFIGNQYRISTETKDYYIDLLLFHRKLKSLIAVELKIGEFIPEYAGKMQFYLALLDDKVKNHDENPSIGIIICKNKDRTDVEYALRLTDAPIGVATYKITKTLPDSMKSILPGPEIIAERILKLKEITE